jgi:P pilus assembly chaperone PapD
MKMFSIAVIVLTSLYATGQSVAVSPSRLYYKVDVGNYQNQVVRITNNATAPESFVISFGDFEAPGSAGKSELLPAGTSPHSCSQWLSADPSYFTLEPGLTQDVRILLQVPNTPEANGVKWATAMIKLAKEKNKPDSNDGHGMGIAQTFQFVVHIFQTPPTVTYKKVEITNFREISLQTDTMRQLMLSVKNIGDAILDCAAYVDITSLTTGEEERIKPFGFTVLPGGARDVKFILPKTLKTGKYSLLGVVDYGSDAEIEAAEMELFVQ